MRNPLKRAYFVCAQVKTRKKGTSRIQENYHNGIINVPIFHKKDFTLLNNLTMTFAKNISEQNKDLEIKGLVIISLNKV